MQNTGFSWQNCLVTKTKPDYEMRLTRESFYAVTRRIAQYSVCEEMFVTSSSTSWASYINNVV